MSTGIKIHEAVKRFGDNTVIHNLSVDIKEGEFFTLLGPSGCGKTTLLRMIAGFNSIEGGDFYFDAQRINDLDPAKRNIGMVFQNYAIFPHLTVEENVAFGLQNQKIDKKEIKERAHEFLKLMQIEQFAKRKPDQLSGGQQQRVALARALVIQPDVLLMDEPLSNLDAKLRVEMREIIKEIQHRVGITTVYVTHDQEEAMAVSDRVAVMNFGVIQQIATPKQIYQRPSNTFVASFIGQTNILNAHLEVQDDHAELVFANEHRVAVDHLVPGVESQDVIVSIRPEEFEIKKSEHGIHGVVENISFLGMNTKYFIKAFDDQVLEVVQESMIDQIDEVGATVELSVKADKINIFTADGTRNLVKGVVDDNGDHQ